VTNKAEPFAKLPPQVPADGQYREIHIRIKDHPNTAMAISTDLGPGIHPTNKWGYGQRAARVALGKVYDKKVEYYGPVYASHSVDGGKVRIKFTHIGEGLAFTHGDKLQGFAMAGEDKVFHWAEATIDGDAVVLSCPNVTKPVAVRYAWSQRAPWANLFNKDRLPAIPFRTDEW
jgi:sialate O-acetylesterase